jgi:hypothetical protein
MKNCRIKPAVSRAIAANEIQTLATRPKLDPMPELESRVFSLCGRIAVGLLYLACFVAAVA